MSASQVNPHDKMRSRDVNKVAKGEQVPRPAAHEPDTVSQPPPPKQVDKELSKSKGSEQDKRDDEEEEMVDLETTPVDMHFPFINQTRHCYARYLEYHRCIQGKGEHAPKCERFARHYRSLCPSEWVNGLDTVESWNEQKGTWNIPWSNLRWGLLDILDMLLGGKRVVEKLGKKSTVCFMGVVGVFVVPQL